MTGKSKTLVLWRGLGCSCEVGGTLNPAYHEVHCDWRLRWEAELADPTLIPGRKNENAEIRDHLGYPKTFTF